MITKKTLLIENIKNIFSNNPYIAIYQDSGLSIKEYNQLQLEAQKYNLKILHLKNKLSKVALINTPYVHFSNLFEGPCIIIFGPSNIKKPQSVYALHENFGKLLPVGGMFKSNYISSKQFSWISSIDNIDIFHLSVINMLITHSTRVVNNLDLLSKGLVKALEVSSDNKQ